MGVLWIDKFCDLWHALRKSIAPLLVREPQSEDRVMTMTTALLCKKNNQ